MVDLEVRPDGDRLVIELDPGEPIDLGELSDSFAALARMYDRHHRTSGEGAPKLYVTKIVTGSVVMEIAPYVVLMGVISVMDGSIIVSDFAGRLWRGIKAFSGTPVPAAHIAPPSLDDARDIREFTKPLLGKRGATLGIKHAKYVRSDGSREVMVEYSFDEAQLNRAAINIEKALDSDLYLDAPPVPSSVRARHEVMLFLDQANRGPGKQSGRTGDKGIIPDVSEKPLPVYFRKSFQNLKDHMIRDVNPLTSTFVVDVFVQYVHDEPKGYIVTEVHQAIPGDESAA